MNIVYKKYLLALLVILSSCKVGRSAYKFDLGKVEFDSNTYPIVVIGGGISGLTAGIYGSQANLKTIVLEGKEIGGALSQSHSVRNWPGVEDAPGQEIADKIKTHAINSGAIVVQEVVESVDFSVWPYLIRTKQLTGDQNTKTLKALSCIIAMGATPNTLKIEGEKEYFGKGVSTCAVCDGPLYKDKIVGIIGGGNSAIEEASYLSSIAKKVYIFVRRDKFRAVGKVKDEIISRNNIEVKYNTNIKEIKGNGKKITTLVLFNNKTNESSDLPVDGLFYAIGSKPNSQIFNGQIQLDKQGYIKLKKDQQTSKEGIFAAGDIADPVYKQAIASSGTACVASIQAQHFLDEIGYDPIKYNQPVKQTEKVESEKKPTAEKESKPENKTSSGALVKEILTIEEFKSEVLESKIPVVVDFFATWCIPCQQMLPVFKDVAKTFENKIKFVKLNINKNMEIANELDIYSVPTFMFLKDGKEVKRIIGGMPKDAFIEKTKEILL